MAFARRRFFPRSGGRFVRRKRQGAWTGTGVIPVTLTQNVTSSFYLWSDITSQRLNMAGRGVHQRTLLHFGISPGDITVPFHIAWSLMVHQTDAGNDVPTSALFRPWTDWASLAEKSPLDMGFRTGSPNQGTSLTGNLNFSLQRDIKVKRRMDDTDALMLALEFVPLAGTGQTYRLWFASRTYVTW